MADMNVDNINTEAIEDGVKIVEEIAKSGFKLGKAAKIGGVIVLAVGTGYVVYKKVVKPWWAKRSEKRAAKKAAKAAAKKAKEEMDDTEVFNVDPVPPIPGEEKKAK